MGVASSAAHGASLHSTLPVGPSAHLHCANNSNPLLSFATTGHALSIRYDADSAGLNFRQDAAAPHPAVVTGAVAPQVVRHILENGMQATVCNMPHANTVTLAVAIAVGSMHETANEHGLAHALEHNLYKGSDAPGMRTAAEVTSRIDMSSGFNAWTSRNQTVFHVQFEPSQMRDMLDTHTAIMSKPLFRASDLEPEKQVIVNEIDASEKNLMRKVYETVMNMRLLGSSFEPSIIGTRASVASFTPAKLREFWAKFYVPANMAISIVGNLSAEPDMLGLLERTFGTMRKGSAAQMTRIKDIHMQNEVTFLDSNGVDKWFHGADDITADTSTVATVTDVKTGDSISRMADELHRNIPPVDPAQVVTMRVATSAVLVGAVVAAAPKARLEGPVPTFTITAGERMAVSELTGQLAVADSMTVALTRELGAIATTSTSVRLGHIPVPLGDSINFAISYMMPGFTRDTETMYADLTKTMLGGYMSSLITNRLRTAGLIYSMSSEVVPYSRISFVVLSSMTSVENLRPTLSIIYEEIQKLHDGLVDADTFEKARVHSKAKIAAAMDDTQTSAQMYATTGLHNMAPLTSREMMRNLDATTPQGVQLIARKVFVPGNMSVVFLGDLAGNRPAELLVASMLEGVHKGSANTKAATASLAQLVESNVATMVMTDRMMATGQVASSSSLAVRRVKDIARAIGLSA
jgi:predicted Zn-dependent peptidase